MFALYRYPSCCEGHVFVVPKALVVRGRLAGWSGLPHERASERPASSGVRSLKGAICCSADEPAFTSIIICV